MVNGKRNITEVKKLENQINFFTIQDIFNERDKNEPIDPTKVYDPLHFWEDYGENYFKSFEKREQFQFGLNGNNPVAWLAFKLKSLNAEKVLEAGCGFGRLAPFIIDAEAAKEYVGVDFSSKILKCHEAYLKNYVHMDKVSFKEASAKRMPFPNKSFDVVLCSELLMHMTRTKADHCLREFRRLSKKYIIIVERYVYQKEHPYPHIWSHNLPDLIDNLGFIVLESKLVGNGMIGVICKI